MAVIVVAAVVVLVAFFTVIAIVVVQIHLEERLHLEERRHRKVCPVPLIRPARGGCARFARSVCGVYITGFGEEPAPEPGAEEIPAWYERSGGPNWR